jgi:hypothetical protein
MPRTASGLALISVKGMSLMCTGVYAAPSHLICTLPPIGPNITSSLLFHSLGSCTPHPPSSGLALISVKGVSLMWYPHDTVSMGIRCLRAWFCRFAVRKP